MSRAESAMQSLLKASSAMNSKCLTSGVFVAEQIFDAKYPEKSSFSSRYSSFAAAIVAVLVASSLLCGCRWCHSKAPVSFTLTEIGTSSLSLRTLYRFG